MNNTKMSMPAVPTVSQLKTIKPEENYECLVVLGWHGAGDGGGGGVGSLPLSCTNVPLVTLLLLRVGSSSFALTLALFQIVAATLGMTTITTVAEVPSAMLPRAQSTPVVVGVQLP